jgi:hypothetical protein
MAMRIVWTVLIVVLIAALICWVRSGSAFNVVQALPLLGGHPPGIFDLGAFVMILITIWGVRRLTRNRSDR